MGEGRVCPSRCRSALQRADKAAERERRKRAYEELNELYFDRGMEDLDDVETYLSQFE